MIALAIFIAGFAAGVASVFVWALLKCSHKVDKQTEVLKDRL